MTPRSDQLAAAIEQALAGAEAAEAARLLTLALPRALLLLHRRLLLLALDGEADAFC